MSLTDLPVLKPKDYASNQDVRWCPGCGDYAILKQVQRVLSQLKARKENTVFVAGIGCSSRFPYYMDTYGMHSIHGRAPAFATGVKIANPELDVWMVTGDGDGLSIGGNHLIHLLRRNVNLNVMLFNNRIYGLTKGQYSPTSETGKKTKTSPLGSIDMPINPLSLALAAEASFVARAVDVDPKLPDVLQEAAEHRGSSFVEIYQDCNVFNHFAFKHTTDKDTKEDNIVRLENGKPMIFGKDRDKGVRLSEDGHLEVVTIGEQYQEDDLLFHDETDEQHAFLLSRMRFPEFPEPMGVMYRVKADCYEDHVEAQVQSAVKNRGRGTIEQLLYSGDTWEVK